MCGQLHSASEFDDFAEDGRPLEQSSRWATVPRNTSELSTIYGALKISLNALAYFTRVRLRPSTCFVELEPHNPVAVLLD